MQVHRSRFDDELGITMSDIQRSTFHNKFMKEKGYNDQE